MAGLTRLDDGDVRLLARAFRLGELTAWREVPAGTINSNYRVEAGGRSWFLRVNEGKSEADVRWEAQLVGQLAASGVSTPAPVPAEDGSPLWLHRDRWVSVFPWVAGVHRDQHQVSESDAAAVGAALAQLHRAAAPMAGIMPRTGIYTTAHIAQRLAALQADPMRARDPALSDALAASADELVWLEQRRAQREAAPHGIIHGDLFRDNVLFEGRRLAALLDFEQASLGAWVYDLAVCLNAWCFAGSFDPALVRAMTAGYAGVRPLDAFERDLLHVEVRAAAVRFTITRITDVYCRGLQLEGKDFRRFASRLAAWRQLGPDGLAAWVGE